MAKSCLVVDDSRIVRTMARRILEGFGFEVAEAEDGQKAFDHCSGTMPDCILLDWNMPIMSGLEFLVALRKEANGKSPKVIFCSTESDAEHVKQGMEAGANGYIIKPFDENVIKTKFSEAGIL